MLRLRATVAAAALAAGLVSAMPAGASGDFFVSPTWSLSHPDLTGADNMMLLGPGNDTRVNLTLLLFDRRGAAPAPGKGAPPEPLGALFDWMTLSQWLAPKPADTNTDYSTGEGSRCRSNDSGAAAFVAAVTAAKLPGGEHDALVTARQGLKPDCAKPGDVAAAVAALEGSVKSPAGKGFSAYLSGTQAFYGGDFDTAATRFGSLRDAKDPWVRETARYMAGRVEVNRVQVNLFDEYGNPKSFDTIDQKAIAAADTDLRDYLKDYPKGLYAASAQGLLRRVYWFGSKRNRLAAQYVAMFGVAPGARGINDVDLAEEMDNKLLPGLKTGDTTDPTLLAVLDLRRMRVVDAKTAEENGRTVPGDLISAEELNGQRGAFAGNMPLFDFLLASRAFYVDKKPAEVLRLIPDAAKQPNFSEVQFSRQMLRGMALESVKDRNARGFWLEMFPGATVDAQHSALELALALHDERAGTVGNVFAANSPVDDPIMRNILLANIADAGLLRTQARGAKAPHERDIATFILLYKELSRGAYRDFLGDAALVPAGAPADGNFFDLTSTEPFPLGLFVETKPAGDFDCPAIRSIATTLAKAPGDAHAKVCLADFFRAHNFDGIALDTQPSKDQLGGTPTLFAGPVYSRLEVYKSVIAAPATAPSDKAYALYRAVMCYAPSGTNSCGGVEVDKAQRKAWFQRLKTDYPKSSWASGLRYYW